MDEFSEDKNYSKYSSKTIFLIAIALLLVVFFYIVGYNVVEEVQNNKTVYTESDLVGNFVFSSPKNKDSKVRLYLRKDGTFRYNDSAELETPYVGKYRVEGENLILDTKITYGSDYCYYTQEKFLRPFTLKIIDNNKLSTDGPLWYPKKIVLRRDDTLAEKEEDLNFYILDPIDGVNPKGRKHIWVYCNTDYLPEYEKINSEYVGTYTSNEGDSIIYLRDIGTFRYITSDTTLVGKYTIFSDKIVLYSKTSYGNNNCFHENTRVYNLLKNGDGSLSLYSELFRKDETKIEPSAEQNYYIPYPKDGAVAKEASTEWKVCSIKMTTTTTTVSPTYEGYDKISNQSTNGIYNKLSLILDSTFEFTRVKKMTNISKALSINGNIFNNESIKNEFAFQYGYYNEYSKYSEGNSDLYLKPEEFSSVYKRVYDEDKKITKNYKSSVIDIYEGNNQYRFSEVSNNYINGSYKAIAKIYNSQNDCNNDLKLTNSSFCRTNGKEIGKIEIEYAKNNTDTIFKSISLYEKKG